jgi:flagellar biosynthesis chaperone FliJ
MRDLETVSLELEAAATHYQTLERRLRQIEDQREAALDNLSRQASVVVKLMDELDTLESEDDT